MPLSLYIYIHIYIFMTHMVYDSHGWHQSSAVYIFLVIKTQKR